MRPRVKEFTRTAASEAREREQPEHRASGITPPDGNNGAPQSYAWVPDLRRRQFAVSGGVMVKF
jgi:hypothetical protein